MTGLPSALLEVSRDEEVEDLFLARTVPLAFHGARLRFDLATSVFSSAGIDPGSALLLRHLQTIDHRPGARVIDLGCGHGVLGLTLLALDPTRHLTMVDRDALACAYSARNLELNGLPADRVTIGGSLGFDDLDPNQGPFDLIVSNVPGKAGDDVIADLVAPGLPWSGPGTVVAVVVVAPLAPLIRNLLAPPHFEVLVDKGNKVHQVVIARQIAGPERQRPPSTFAAGLYDRSRAQFRIGDLEWEATTVTGLDEFDNLSFATQLLRSALRGVRSGPCTMIDPGTGHRAVVAARSGQRIDTVISRDLLALRSTARMVGSVRGNDPTLVHSLSAPSSLAPLTIIHADDKVHTPWLAHQVSTVIAQARAVRGTSSGRRSSRGGADAGGHQVIVVGRASPLGRIEADLLERSGARLAHKQTRNGARAVRYQFRS